MNYLKSLMMCVVCVSVLSFSFLEIRAQVDPSIVPEYVFEGLREYETNGYEAAVAAWLADSPYRNAITLASNNAFFRNIQKLAGGYISYDILVTKETISSNVVYVRMNFERVSGYILFTSLKREKKWVLGRMRLDRMQQMGSTL